MDNRRQSGLWAENPAHGYYEQQPRAPPGPYQYYEPPTRSSEDKNRPPYSQRAGTENAQSSQAPATYAPTNGAPRRSNERKVRDIAEGVSQKLQRQAPESSASEQFAGTQHINSTRLPGSSAQQPFSFSADAVPSNVRDKPWSPDPISTQSLPKQRNASNASETLRRGSVPDRSPLQKLEMNFTSKQEKRAKLEEAELKARQKSVGGGEDRRQQAPAPQRAEGELLKQGTLRNEKERVRNDGSRRASEGAYNPRREDDARRQVSAGTAPSYGQRREEDPRRQATAGAAPVPGRTDEGGLSRFRRASEALKDKTSREKDYDAAEPQAARPAQPVAQQQNPAPQQRYYRALSDARENAQYPEAREQQGKQYPGAGREQQAEHYSGAGRAQQQQQYPPTSAREQQKDQYSNLKREQQQDPVRNDGGLERTASGKYRHRARDAGFAGAAAAMASAGVVGYDSAAERGKAAHERRRGQLLPAQQGSPQDSPVSPTSQEAKGSFGRSNSKKLQKRAPPPTEWRGKGENSFRGPQEQASASSTAGGEPQIRQNLQTSRQGGGKDAAYRFQDPDPLPPSRVANEPDEPLHYKIPPQTAGGQEAREKVGFGGETNASQAHEQAKHHHLGGLFHRQEHVHRTYQPGEKPLEEWRNAGAARLTLEDMDFDQAGAAANARDDSGEKDAAWWERNSRRSGSRQSGNAMPQFDGPFEEEAKAFRPQMLLKCGPLLRYTGMRKHTPSTSTGGRGGVRSEREIWRGSVMIVTYDDKSDYSTVPTLRIFAQPMDLLPKLPPEMLASGQELPPEYEDPVAGQVKVSRTGRPLYVRHVHEIDGGIDLSREENPQGLYAATRTPMLGPQSVSGDDGRQIQHISFEDKSRIKKRDGEKMSRYREVRAARLHAERGCTFWRFNIEIELASTQRRVAYRINRGPAIGFWVPARGETMNMMFHSCNGFSLSVDPNTFSGPDPLWRDVLNRHQSRPFHVMIGGGDQIYNDAAMRDTTLFREWLAEKNPEHKHRADFTPEMQDELETFYLDRYAMWFSQGLFGMANSQIPMVNIWDDHDIIDGFGSYPHHFMANRVFTGLGAVAFKYYMLFQHQSLVAETEVEEPSWVLGASPGPYINELSRSVFLRLGRKVAFLGLDCRTERMRDEILSEQSYDIVFDRLREEIQSAEGATQEIKHLIVLLGVPIAYPRLNFLENILTSRVMDPIKAIGRTGMLGGFVNKFDGGVEILDDLDDHWTAKHHKQERNWFVQELQELAAEKSVRITILGGDVHLGAVGQFYTPKKFGIPKDQDHRYMPNVISSAIVNTPPPNMMADVLNRRNRVHHLDDETDEDLIPMFDHDVDGRPRGNKHLLPRRNYCTIREYIPGSTPPPTPKREMPGSPGIDGSQDGGFDGDEGRNFERDRRFPPGSMKRTMSLTRGPGALIRRLSGSGRSKNPPISLAPEHARPYSAHSQATAPGMGRSQSFGGPRQSMDAGSGSYFPPQADNARPSFHRRPTNLSIKEARKAAAKGGADGNLDGREAGHINLEGGLDISLMMEIDQHDPSGMTEPYRLLVPALWYEGEGDENTAEPHRPSRGLSLMDRLRGRGRGREAADEDYSRSPTPSPPPSAGRGQEMDGAADHGHRTLMGQVTHNAAMSRNQNLPQDSRQQNNAGPPPSAASAGQKSSVGAYNKGYNLASPPIGARGGNQQVQSDPLYPQSGYRRASAPTGQQGNARSPQFQQANEPWRQFGTRDEHSDDASLTPSDEYINGPPRGNGNISNDAAPAAAAPPPRRLSKAERFFGIGEEGGPWGGNGGGAGGAGGRRPSFSQQQQQRQDSFDESGGVKKRPNWMIWR